MLQSIPDSLFSPTCVAIVGANEKPGRIGSGLYKSITDGFQGEVYCVNPQHAALFGKPCYSSILDIPARVSHAVIAVGRDLVLPYVQQCVTASVRHIIIISAGFQETDAKGAELERQITALCRKHDITLLGPNTLGLIHTRANFNCTFLPDKILPGHVSLISQSGGVGMAVLAALRDQRCGISKWVGVGNQAMVEAADVLRYLADDPDTSVIGVCFEGLHNMPEFLKLAEEINRKKPIVLLRDGKTATGKKAAASHTGSLIRSSRTLHDLIAQHGLIEADSCRSCAVMLKALSLAPASDGARVAVLSNTAGPAILACDRLELGGASLPQPGKALQEEIDRAAGRRMGLKNPADISSNGLSPETYRAAATTILSSKEYDVLLGFFSLNRHLSLPDRELMQAAQAAGKPAVACFLCSAEDFAAYDLRVERAGIPCYYDPADAAEAVLALTARAKSLKRAPCPAEPRMLDSQRKAARQYLSMLGLTAEQTLSERLSKELLSLAGFQVIVPKLAKTPQSAQQAAEAFGYPVALKIESSVISHKSDVGGVRLGIQNECELLAAFSEMQSAIQTLDPEAELTVQPMAQDGFELLLGSARLDGAPLLTLGLGGVYAEVFADTCAALAPFDEDTPEKMLRSLRLWPILDGYRGGKFDCQSVAELMHRLADLMQALPEISELDLNPCRVSESGTAILDARLVIKP